MCWVLVASGCVNHTSQVVLTSQEKDHENSLVKVEELSLEQKTQELQEQEIHNIMINEDLKSTIEAWSISSIDTRPFLSQNVYAYDINSIDRKEQFISLNPEDFDTIVGGIIPHHNLAHTLISDFYELASTKVEKNNEPYDLIVIMSPNHKSIGPRFQVGDDNYTTYDNIVETNQEIVSQCLNSEFIDLASVKMMSQEHGQLVHMPYISHYFPNTKVLSIVITEYRNNEKIEQVVDDIYPLIQDLHVLYIASIDFSHYLTLLEAEKNDEYTYEQLKTSNVKNLINKSNDFIDAPSTYALFIEFMNRVNGKPTVTNHSNAAIILNDPYMVETTSYFQVVYE